MTEADLIKLAEIEEAIAGLRLVPSDELLPVVEIARYRAKAFRRLAHEMRNKTEGKSK